MHSSNVHSSHVIHNKIDRSSFNRCMWVGQYDDVECGYERTWRTSMTEILTEILITLIFIQSNRPMGRLEAASSIIHSNHCHMRPTILHLIYHNNCLVTFSRSSTSCNLGYWGDTWFCPYLSITMDTPYHHYHYT